MYDYDQYLVFQTDKNNLFCVCFYKLKIIKIYTNNQV